MINKAFDFFPDGKHCVAGRLVENRPVLAVVNVASGASVRQFPLPGIPHSVSVSRNGNRIAISVLEVNGDKDRPGHVVVLDGETGAVTGEAAAPQPRALAWSPVEDSLAVCSSSVLWVWHDEEWTTARLELRGHTDTVDAVTWNPDGRVLASQGWEGMVRLWDPFQGTPLSWHPGRGSSLGFSPDGSRLGLIRDGEKLMVLEVSSGNVCYRGRGHAGGVYEGAWNQKGIIEEAGVLMATAGNDGVRIWNREGRHLAWLKLPRARGLAFSADSLFVGCEAGLFRCRISSTPGPDGITVTFLPPEKMDSFNSCEQLALSADDALLALAGRRPGPGGKNAAGW